MQLGATDCEYLGSGWLRQPVNAWTSLAYAGIGLALIASARASRGRERPVRVGFGLLLVVTGVGSFLFHGPETPIAHFAHDVSFLLALWGLAALNLAATGRIPARRLVAGSLVVALILTGTLLITPGATNWLTGASVLALAVSDVWRRQTIAFRRTWYVAAVALLLGSLLANALGRSGMSTCDPSSLIQYHGLWHILTAASLGAYFIAVLPGIDREAA